MARDRSPYPRYHWLIATGRCVQVRGGGHPASQAGRPVTSQEWPPGQGHGSEPSAAVGNLPFFTSHSCLSVRFFVSTQRTHHLYKTSPTGSLVWSHILAPLRAKTVSVSTSVKRAEGALSPEVVGRTRYAGFQTGSPAGWVSFPGLGFRPSLCPGRAHKPVQMQALPSSHPLPPTEGQSIGDVCRQR